MVVPDPIPKPTLALANAFSIGMLRAGAPGTRHAVQFTLVTPEHAARLLQHARNVHEAAAEAFGRRSDFRVISTIRHPATEAIALSILGLSPDQIERAQAVTLERGVTLLVFMPRWKGGRAPETREYTAEELSTLAEGVDIWMCSLI
jgi:hypothetical protein